MESGRIVVEDSLFAHNVAATGDAVTIGPVGNPTITDSAFRGNAPTLIDGNWRNGGGYAIGPFCPIGDLDGDESVTLLDLLALLDAWDKCGDSYTCLPDFNADGMCVEYADPLGYVGLMLRCRRTEKPADSICMPRFIGYLEVAVLTGT